MVATDTNGFIAPFEVRDFFGNKVVRPDFEKSTIEPYYAKKKMFDIYAEHYKNQTIKYDDLLR